MTYLPPRITARKQRRGFSLIEAAVVLGVVGLVIGGIWVAAAAVNDRLKWKQTEAGWLYYMDLIGKNYSHVGATLQDIDYTFLVNMPVPDGWKVAWFGCCGNHPIDPYGYALYAQVQTDGTVLVSYPSVQTIRRDVCLKLARVMRLRISPIYKIVLGGPPASCDTDISSCCPDPANGIAAYFQLP